MHKHYDDHSRLRTNTMTIEQTVEMSVNKLLELESSSTAGGAGNAVFIG